jgi:hypothetical protein
MRQPKPYLKKTHNCYYVNLNGKPVRLDPDEKKAWEEWHLKYSNRLRQRVFCSFAGAPARACTSWDVVF